MGDREQWYSNKDLFEQINSMKSEFQVLRQEMKETREIIRKYNGLRKELYELQCRIAKMEERKLAKKSVGDAFREWGGWIIAILMFVINIIKLFI